MSSSDPAHDSADFRSVVNVEHSFATSDGITSESNAAALDAPPTVEELAILGEGMAKWNAEQQRRAELEGMRFPAPVAGTRRFDLATFLLATTVFALAVTAVRLAGLPQLLMVHLVAVVPLVGIGQALLFHGRRPRTAAALIGACYVLLLGGLNLEWSLPPRVFDLPTIIFGFVVGGGVLGMLVGALVNGVFLALAAARRPRLSRDELPEANPTNSLRATQAELTVNARIDP